MIPLLWMQSDTTQQLASLSFYEGGRLSMDRSDLQGDADLDNVTALDIKWSNNVLAPQSVYRLNKQDAQNVWIDEL